MKKGIIKNLGKFLFEFIIVTLGILTAFNINKWDENNKLIAEEKEAYEAFRNDLKADLYVLNYYKQAHLQGKRYLKPLIENNFEELDSLEYYMHVAFDLQEGNATYINLKYSGKLRIIKNLKMKRKLFLYYETYYQGLENLAHSHSILISDKVQPYFLENFKLHANREDIRNYLESNHLLKLIEYQYTMLKTNLEAINKSEVMVNDIVKLIDEELNVVN